MNWKQKRKVSHQARNSLHRALLQPVEVLERRMLLSTTVSSYRNGGTGGDTQETSLTPATVNAANFGKLFSTVVDGQIYAEPLYLPSVQITAGSSAGTHSVTFVATEHDSVYAIDSKTGTVLWQRSFLNASSGITTVPSADTDTTDIYPEVGITSTPVIDPATGVLYVEASTKQIINSVPFYSDTLHGINIGDGSDAMAPDVIAETGFDGTNYTFVKGPTVAGSGQSSVNGVITFNALRQLQRSALTLSNGHIYVAYASNSDNGPYHGWVLGFQESNLAISAVFNDCPNGSEAGIWEAGDAVVVDSEGNLYVSTGNGTFDTSLDANGFPVKGDYGDSIIKLTPDASTAADPNINGWGLKVADYFSPFNQQSLSNGDFDLGSGGIDLLPGAAGSAAHPNLLVATGKEGRIYLVDINNMGKFNPNTDQVVQEVNDGLTGSFDTPAYYNGQLYYVGSYVETAKTFSLSNAQLSTQPTSVSADVYQYPGSTPFLSSNGSTGGIVWDLDKGTNQLRAYNASSYADELWTSGQAANNRDLLGSIIKFTVPTVADGEVFVGTANSVTAYGILVKPSSKPPAPGNLAAVAAPNNTINLNWTDNSTNAADRESGFIVQESLDGQSFAQIGTTPAGVTTFDASGLSPLTTYTFRVLAYNALGNSPYSAPTTATTLAGSAPASISLPTGFAGTASEFSLLGSASISGSHLRLTDGQSNEAADAWLTTPVNVTNFTSDFTFQLENPSPTGNDADGFTFALQSAGLNALGGAGGGLGFNLISNSVGIKFDLFGQSGTDATGIVVDGALPETQPGINLKPSGINLHSGDIIDAALTYNGSNLAVTLTDTVTKATASQSYAIDIPTILGGTTGYVGFTGADGGEVSTQDIDTWQYHPGPPTPTLIAATAMWKNSVALSWTQPASTVTGFYIQESTDGQSFSTVATASAAARSFVLGHLQPQTSYSFRIEAFNAVGVSGPSTALVEVSPSNSPDTGFNYSAGFVSAGSALKDNGAAVTTQAGLLQLTSGAKDSASSVFTTTPYFVGGFSTAFTFQINSPGADGIAFVLQGHSPDAVGDEGGGLGYEGIADSVAVKFDLFNNAGEGSDSTGLFVNGVAPTSSGSIDLTSTGVNLHSGHPIHVTMAYDGVNLTVTETDTVTKAAANQSYPINLAGVLGRNIADLGFTGSTGSLTDTAQISSWVFTPTPTNPTGLTATVTQADQIALSWRESSSLQSGFLIERSTDGVNFFQIAQVANITQYADTSFQVGTQYFYRVRAINAAGPSGYSNVAATEPPVPPAKPSDVTATKVTATEIDLSFQNNANNETGFYILRKDGVDGLLELVDTLPMAPNPPPSIVTFADKGLVPGQTYEYHIEAFNEAGNNDFAGISLYTLPNAPAGLTAVGGDDDVSLTWNASVGATSYNIYRGTVSGGESSIALITKQTGTSFDDQDVLPGGQYFYEVTAVDSSGESARSVEASAITETLSAAYSATAPSDWLAGQTRSFAVTVTNTGTETWPANAPGVNYVDLGYYFDGTSDAIGAWGAEPARVQMHTAVPPGGTYTFNVSAAAPSVAGNYVLRLRLVQENVEWFTDVKDLSVTIVAPLSATYTGSPPTAWQAGQYQTFTVKAVNTGSTTWLPVAKGTNYVDLGYYFNGTSDAIGAWATEPTRVQLHSAVAPGQSYNFSITAQAPTSPGTYILRIRLVQENVSWFSQVMDTTITVAGGTNVVQYHYDNASDGQDNTETVLNPTNVNAGSFGRIWSTAVDGLEYAQPLFLSNVNITSGTSTGTQDVVYVSTENDSLYAINAQTGSILWQDSFLTAADAIATGAAVTAVPSGDLGPGSISPVIGITGTPVIDPSTGILYLDDATKQVVNGVRHYVWQIQAVNTSSGALLAGSGSVIADTAWDGTNFSYVAGPTVNGTGDGSINGKLTFNAVREQQRPGLSINGGNVYISYASNADNGPYHGWILGFSQKTLAMTAAFCTTPNGGEGGIWQSAGALAIDSSGSMYFMTGNGSFSGNLNAQGFPIDGDYGMSMVKIAIDPSSSPTHQNVNGWGLKVVDYFTPFNQNALNGVDGDLGSGSLLLLPAAVGSAAHPNLLVGAGKEGRIYLVDADDMGKYDPNTDQVVQEVTNAFDGSFDTPAYFNGRIYYVGAYDNDHAVAYSIANGVLSVVPSSQSTDTYGFPGSTPVVSSNSGSNAIVWDLDTPSSTLRAYSASNYADELYTSAQAADGRDAIPGSVNKFDDPVIADGQVFVAGQTHITAFGILPAPTAPPTPPVNLSAQAVSEYEIQVNWANTSTDQTAVAVQQSTDGVNFTTVATLQGYPTGYLAQGLQPGANYTFRLQAVDGVGTAGFSTTVSQTTLADADNAAIDFSDGFGQGAGTLTLNGSAAVAAGVLQLTGNVNASTGSVFVSKPVSDSIFYSSFDFTTTGAGEGFALVLQNKSATALGTSGAGLGYGGLSKSVALVFDLYDNTAGVQANYTGVFSNGQLPTSATAQNLSSAGLNFHSGDLFNVQLDYNGTTLSETITDTVTDISTSKSFNVKISTVIGANTAFVGFTGSTGSGTITAVQRIVDWVFVPGQLSPSQLQATAVTSTQLTLNWLEPATTQSAIDIEQSIDGVNYYSIGQALASAKTYLVGGLQPGATYWFRAKAANSFGDSDYSNVATVTTPAGTAVSNIDYSGGFASARSALYFQASLANNPSIVGSALQLIDGGTLESTAAFYKTQVPVASFNNYFTFQIPNSGADGFTFVLQNDSGRALGHDAGGLGYNTITSSVAIKFDFYNTGGQGNNSTGLYTQGQYAGQIANSIDLTGTGIDFHSGDAFGCSMAYANNALTVIITDLKTQKSATQNYSVNIPQLVGGDTAWAGFTASTQPSVGGVVQILSWKFVPDPSIPTGLTATPVSGNEIDLTWKAADATHTGFSILRSTDGVSFSTVGSSSTDSFADTTFTGGVKYYYEVEATNAAGASLPSAAVSVVDPTPPLTPTDGHTTLVTATSISLAWTNNATNATGYHIYRRQGSGGDVLIATLPANSVSYVDDNNGAGLIPGTVYDYHIQCFNISGFNDFTGVSTETLCLAPTNVAASGSSVITISWAAAAGAVSYDLYRSTVSGAEKIAVITGLTTLSFVDNDLADNTRYYYTVTAVDATGQSVQSAEVSAMTADVAPVIIDNSPFDDSTNDLVTSTVTAVFSKAMEASSFTASTAFISVEETGTVVAASISYNSASDTLTLTPQQALAKGQSYTVTIKGGDAGVKDSAGTAMYADFTWDFSTSDA